jgi:hypothetical protein
LFPLFATGAVETGGKFAAGIVDTCGKFATDINNLVNISANFRKNLKLFSRPWGKVIHEKT